MYNMYRLDLLCVCVVELMCGCIYCLIHTSLPSTHTPPLRTTAAMGPVGGCQTPPPPPRAAAAPKIRCGGGGGGRRCFLPTAPRLCGLQGGGVGGGGGGTGEGADGIHALASGWQGGAAAAAGAAAAGCVVLFFDVLF